jgi:hypothetical protein
MPRQRGSSTVRGSAVRLRKSRGVPSGGPVLIAGVKIGVLPPEPPKPPPPELLLPAVDQRRVDVELPGQPLTVRSL